MSNTKMSHHETCGICHTSGLCEHTPIVWDFSSRAEMTELVMPGDTNPHGTLFGGKLVQWIDMVAAIAASRHAGTCVTASMDSVMFKKPIRVGEVVTLKASVNRSWDTSMEVGVKVFREDMDAGNRSVACKAYLTFVAIHEDGKRRSIKDQIVPKNDEDKRRFLRAEERRQIRLANKDKY